MTQHDAPARPRSRNLVIVPAFNEAGSIAAVIDDLHRHVPGCDILVVDDGSTDDTARQARAHHAGPEKPGDEGPGQRLTVVSLPFNQGIGGAMQTGYRYAARHGYAAAVQVDGDGQHPADQVPCLIEHLRRTGAGLVIGSRFLNPQSSIRNPQTPYRPPPSRMAGIRFLRLLLRILVGQWITDCTSGFRAADREVIHAFARWYPDDYPEPEVIVLLHRAGFTIEEVPVRMAPRTAGRTSIPFFSGVFYVLKVSAALMLDLMRSPWPGEVPQMNTNEHR